MSIQAFYERADRSGWPIDSWETANHLLGYLHPDKSPSASFTLPDGSYIQCAGGKRRLTVEVHVKQRDGTNRHFVFGKGRVSGIKAFIPCAVGPITTDETQVLTLRQARLIMRHFLETKGSRHPEFVATEETP